MRISHIRRSRESRYLPGCGWVSAARFAGATIIEGELAVDVLRLAACLVSTPSMMHTMNPLNISTAAPTQSTTAGRTSSAARLTALAVLLCGAAFGAMAQYKIVGPDGH